MIRTLDLRPLPAGNALRDAVPRAELDIAGALEAAGGVLEQVRERGAAALVEQAERFDGGAPAQFRVDAGDLAAAAAALDPAVRSALTETIARVRAASTAQVPASRTTSFGPDAVIEQRWIPVDRAGLYVPGGKAAYPSSVVMNVVPAQAAGVSSIVVATPGQREFGGGAHPVVLGALALLGVDEVWVLGGPGAIGALAYGVPELGLAPVDVITGPGNNFVAAAKRLVSGTVGVDAEAGATEILIIGDEHADARMVAADLLSQAEHDESAAAVLVTDSESLVAAVRDELDAQVDSTPNAARASAALDGRQSALVLVEDLESAARFAEAYSAEHLSVQTQDADSLAGRIRNAGAIFVGRYSPVSVGDYLAGSNHVLPTGGQARFSGGLSALAFLRPQQRIRYGREGLRAVAPHVIALAAAEGLPAHGDAVAARFAPGEATGASAQ